MRSMHSMLLKVWCHSQEITIVQSYLLFTSPAVTLLLSLINSPSWPPENSCILVHMLGVTSILRPSAILVLLVSTLPII